MRAQPNLASVAYLIADPTRATMLMTLVDGRAWPAGELAHAAGVTAQTAGAHLAKLLAGGLLTVKTEGRHRHYRLAGYHVALVLEHLALIGTTEPVRRRLPDPEACHLRLAALLLQPPRWAGGNDARLAGAWIDCRYGG